MQFEEQSISSEASPQSSCLSHLKASLMQFPLEQWKDPAGQALDLHMKGRRLSQVVNSQDCPSSVRDTSTHSPSLGSG